MITLEFSDADVAALEYERYHHPHPQAQRKMEVVYLKSQGLSHQQMDSSRSTGGNRTINGD